KGRCSARGKTRVGPQRGLRKGRLPTSPDSRRPRRSDLLPPQGGHARAREKRRVRLPWPWGHLRAEGGKPMRVLGNDVTLAGATGRVKRAAAPGGPARVVRLAPCERLGTGPAGQAQAPALGRGQAGEGGGRGGPAQPPQGQLLLGELRPDRVQI